jgi:hypothetical protein
MAPRSVASTARSNRADTPAATDRRGRRHPFRRSRRPTRTRRLLAVRRRSRRRLRRLPPRLPQGPRPPRRLEDVERPARTRRSHRPHLPRTRHLHRPLRAPPVLQPAPPPPVHRPREQRATPAAAQRDAGPLFSRPPVHGRKHLPATRLQRPSVPYLQPGERACLSRSRHGLRRCRSDPLPQRPRPLAVIPRCGRKARLPRLPGRSRQAPPRATETRCCVRLSAAMRQVPLKGRLRGCTRRRRRPRR